MSRWSFANLWLILLCVAFYTFVYAAIGPHHNRHPEPAVQLIPAVQLTATPTTSSSTSRDYHRDPLSWPASKLLSMPGQDAISPATQDAGDLSRSAPATDQTSPGPILDPSSSVATQGPAVVGATPGKPAAGPSDARAYAATLVSAVQWPCLDQLWSRESGWRWWADNPTSTAYGVAQMLTERSRDYRVQILDGLGYIENRYLGSACLAWNHEVAHGWY